MNPSGNPVKLHGYLGRDVEVSGKPYVVLALLIESATLDKPTGLRIVRIAQVPVVCSGPDYCGANGDMKEGTTSRLKVNCVSVKKTGRWCGVLPPCDESSRHEDRRQPRTQDNL